MNLKLEAVKYKIILALIAIGSVVSFIWGANQQSTLVNTNMYEMDQSAYMDYAKNLSETNYRFVGDRNRMPLYPTIMSLLYRDGMQDKVFFERGKTAGIIIALIGLCVTYFIFKKVSNTLDAAVGTLVAAFTVFVYKAPYFQADVLYYPIALLLFYLLLSLVKKPNAKFACVAGFVGGIGHLTKASVLPTVLLAAAVVLIRGFIPILRKLGKQNAQTADQNYSTWIYVKTAAILLICFHIIIYPYLRTSKERFGRYYYNVNSTFYIWYDSWEQAEQGTKAFGDRQGWPDLPPEDIPSFHKYIREHTSQQILDRFICGFCNMKDRIILSYGYAEFIFVYITSLIVLLWQNRSILLSHLVSHKKIYEILFVLGYFLGFTLLFAWYNPIAGGNRFILILYLPFLYLAIRTLSFAQVYKMHLNLFGRKISASSISLIILLYLAAYMIVIFPFRISTMFGGS